MIANIEALVQKYANLFYEDNNESVTTLLGAVLTEQAEAFKGELQAYDGMVRELTKTVEDMQAAQSVPVVGDAVAWVNAVKLYKERKGYLLNVYLHGESGREIDNLVALYLAPTHSITAAELASLREKAAEADELRKDAERYRWLRDPSVYVGKVIDKVAGYEPMTELGTGGYPIYEYRAGPELDDAIDAAIAQGKGE